MSETYGPINFQSGKVTKKALENSGKTAHREQWHKAPKGHYFVEDSWGRTLISNKGVNSDITIADFKKKAIKITLGNGSVVKLLVVTAFLTVAHAETGSGITATDKTAWVEGEVFAKLQEYD